MTKQEIHRGSHTSGLAMNVPFLKRIFSKSPESKMMLCNDGKTSTLPETNMAPENGWLEYDRFLLGWPIFRGF